MRGMSVRRIPEYVKHFARHQLYPDLVSTLRALACWCVSVRMSEAEFDLARFLILTYPYSDPESRLRDIIRLYQSQHGDLRASEYDPVIQECIAVSSELGTEIWTPDPREGKGIAWRVFILPGEQDYVFIYDTNSDMSNVDIDAITEALVGLDTSSMLRALSNGDVGPLSIGVF